MFEKPLDMLYELDLKGQEAIVGLLCDIHVKFIKVS